MKNLNGLLLVALFAATTAYADPELGWSQKYLEAQKNCKDLLKFKKEAAPNAELAAVVDIKYKEKCLPNQNLLRKLKYSWLKKDIILNGLRATSNPQVFLDYYSAFLQLSSNDRAKIEYIERTRLFNKILDKAKDKRIRNDLFWQFPVLYVDNQQAVPSGKIFEAAYELRMQRRFEEARKLYQKIIVANKRNLKKAKNLAAKEEYLTNISRAFDFIRVIHRVEEKRILGIAEYTKAEQFFENSFLKNHKKELAHFYTDTAAQLARDLWTEGRVGEAQILLQDVVSKSKGHAQLDQVYWVLGRIEQEKKNYSQAIADFKLALQESPEKDFELKLRWLTAWNLKKNKQLDESVEAMRELAERSKATQDDGSYARSLFWQAQIQKKLNHEDEAKKILTELISEEPMGYYGQVARLEADSDSYEKSFDTDIKPIKTDVISETTQQTLEILLQMSEYDIVANYLSSLWHSLEKSSRKQIETHIAFFEWAHSAHLYKENLQYIEILDDDTKNEIIKNYPQLFFPEPYLNIVSQYADKFSLPREFIYALMRQESLFDNNARSSADAFGLLQLLPQIAKKYIKVAGVSFEKPEELFQPEVIIPLGVAHVAELKKIFKGSMMLTAASYNAGVEQVKGWTKSINDEDAYSFVEDIPYSETASYTKLVFRNLSYYLQFHPELSKNQKIKLLKSYFDMPFSQRP